MSQVKELEVDCVEIAADGEREAVAFYTDKGQLLIAWGESPTPFTQGKKYRVTFEEIE